MLEVRTAKEIRGTVILPGDPDLYVMAAITGIASKIPVIISPVPDTNYVNQWNTVLSTIADISRQDTSVTITPKDRTNGQSIDIPSSYSSFADYLIFCCLGMGLEVRIPKISAPLRECWQKLAARSLCTLDIQETDGASRCILSQNPVFTFPAEDATEDELHVFLGIAVGLGAKVSFELDAYPASPLRHLLIALGYETVVKSNIPDKVTDPILKRIRRMKGKKRTLTDQQQSFIMSIDLSKRPQQQMPISLPGDQTLCSLLLAAKTIQQRGNLIIENASMESWATQTLQLVRKMNCAAGLQETAQTSFGAVGMLQLQRFEPEGRKTDCIPLFQFAQQLPAMLVISLFSEGESVFRNLEGLHVTEPDGIEQCMQFLKLIHAHHGEMPDGLVIKGTKGYDGFDIANILPAYTAGAWTIMGLKCIGKSTINDQALIDRWPDFSKMLASICEFRE
jgi:5-enolpyruvylshikimate-3-phosphate synthase